MKLPAREGVSNAITVTSSSGEGNAVYVDYVAGNEAASGVGAPAVVRLGVERTKSAWMNDELTAIWDNAVRKEVHELDQYGWNVRFADVRKLQDTLNGGNIGPLMYAEQGGTGTFTAGSASVTDVAAETIQRLKAGLPLDDNGHFIPVGATVATVEANSFVLRLPAGAPGALSSGTGYFSLFPIGVHPNNRGQRDYYAAACLEAIDSKSSLPTEQHASDASPLSSVSTMTAPAVAPELAMPPAQLTPAQIQKMQQRLADWPQLSRYRDENATVGPPKSGEQRVVFYGDSITDAWGHSHASLFFPGKPYLDRGISGQTTPQMLARFQQDVIDLQPAVVVILAGINDIAGNTGSESLPVIENNFRGMVALGKAAHIRVVLCSVLPASYFPWHKGVDPATEVLKLNEWLKRFAAQQDVVFLNYYPALVNAVGGMREELAADKAVHPNDAGHAIMEPLAEAAVRKALAQPSRP